jgi:hypothetical protein
MSHDLTINVESRPGTVAELGEILGNAGINVDGVAGFDAGGTATVHLLVADGASAREALAAAGVECGPEREVEVVTIVDQPGEMGRHLRRIADAGVDLDLVYLATGTRLVIGSLDPEGLRRAISG